jgi:hypothetical protein
MRSADTATTKQVPYDQVAKVLGFTVRYARQYDARYDLFTVEKTGHARSAHRFVWADELECWKQYRPFGFDRAVAELRSLRKGKGRKLRERVKGKGE